ncbi:hypothetical protein [Pseudescherichia vulneris]|uniref:hypothetical protein n=1 Tax=Pseudescherichia vulneris TaxID=566 RepID=UPI0028B007FB|nr:hypothetical protein [Pseudescherichia vulneris]
MIDKYAVLASYAQHMVDTGRDVAPFTSQEIVELLAERDADRALIAKCQADTQQWKELADAFCADDVEWHALTTSNNELISHLSTLICKQADRIAELTAERDALREGEMGDAKHSNTRAAADIYFQLVEECEIKPGGSLVEHIDDMRQRVAELESRVLVPVEPTLDQLVAGKRQLTPSTGRMSRLMSQRLGEVYRAMVRAAGISLKIEGE